MIMPSGPAAPSTRELFEGCIRQILVILDGLEDGINTAVANRSILRMPQCNLVLTESPPEPSTLGDLPISSNEAYVRSGDQLFYINKAREECIKIEMTSAQLAEFDQKVSPTNEAKRLTANTLGDIIEITGYTPTPDKPLELIRDRFNADGNARPESIPWNDVSRIPADAKAHRVEHLSDWEKIAFLAMFFYSAQQTLEKYGTLHDQTQASRCRTDMDNIKTFIAAELSGTLGFTEKPGYQANPQTLAALNYLNENMDEFTKIFKYYAECLDTRAKIEMAIKMQVAQIRQKHGAERVPPANADMAAVIAWIDSPQNYELTSGLRGKAAHYGELGRLTDILTNHTISAEKRIPDFLDAFHAWRDKYRAEDSSAPGRVFTRNLSRDPLSEPMYKLWEKMKPDYKEYKKSLDTSLQRPGKN